jgi:hypothetical protein
MKDNFIAIVTGKARALTNVLIGLILGFGTLMAIPQVNSLAMPFISAHPTLDAIVGMVVSLSLLLHNPQVAQLLGITVPAPQPGETQKVVVETTAPVDALTAAQGTTASK